MAIVPVRFHGGGTHAFTPTDLLGDNPLVADDGYFSIEPEVDPVEKARVLALIDQHIGQTERQGIIDMLFEPLDFDAVRSHK